MARFDYFVVLAGMRTGSNLLEEELNGLAGLTCHGEVFNPHFVGGPKRDGLFGMGVAERDKDPDKMLSRIASEKGTLSGFRLFQDHDERALSTVLASPRCAKIVLTRNPVDSYVSLKIAKATGQWWLGDATTARRAKARFDADEFHEFLRERRDFYLRVNRALQTSGQTAFHVDYADLTDHSVIAGLGRFLGISGEAGKPKVRAKVQNPQPLSEKVENFDEMAKALSSSDYFDLSRIPNFEPVRGPGVPGFLVADQLKLLFMPLRGCPNDAVADWMAAAQTEPLRSNLKRRDIQHWKRQTPGHHSFTVVAHPLARAHAVFQNRILPVGEGAYEDIRATLINRYDLPLPEGAPGASWSDTDHRRAFEAFLRFLKVNLGGQTSIRIDAEWSSQAGLLQHLAEVMVPDRVFRAEDLGRELSRLAKADFEQPTDDMLASIYSKELESMARSAYARDFMMFGFSQWTGRS